MNLAIINKRLSLGIILISLTSTNLMTYYFTNKSKTGEGTESDSDASAFSSHSGCAYNVKRLSGYDYIKPILLVDDQCESDNLNSVKQSINTIINDYKNAGVITSASVYMKEYVGNGWMGINADEKFLPGSLMKVPQLITFLKMDEANPGFLNKKLTYTHPYIIDKKPIYESKSIELGHEYTIRELLHYMIAYSDNNATSLLFDIMDKKMFQKVFTDFGMTAPNLNESHYPISAKEFTYFMRSLYNASYLSNKNSEFATELLGKCTFKDGIVASLPKSTKIAHKFGESGDPLSKQLNESAIIYLNDTPYILTVMTKGKELKNLSEVIKQISTVAYQSMVTNNSVAASE